MPGTPDRIASPEENDRSSLASRLAVPFHSTLFRVACVLGLLGVAAGAFGAHALVDRVTAERLETFRTAVRYQMFHVPALMVLALLHPRLDRRAPRIAAWCLGLGVLVFSGSLYLLVLLDQSWLGAVTPLGGVSLLAGWAALLLASRPNA